MSNTTNTQINEAIDAVEADIVRVRSVVKTEYKRRYLEKVLAGAKGAKGVSKKAQARSCGDWLALTIAKHCLGEKDKLDVAKFEAILSANGVEHEHWNRTTKGWQGRLRMTGRLALQRVVAEAQGELELADGTTLVAPKSWVAAHTH